MHTLIFILRATLSVFLSALELLMLGRAIISWLPLDEDNPIGRFLYAVTEPVIYPVRVLLERFDLFQGMPIDMSFFFTFILISMLSMFL